MKLTKALGLFALEHLDYVLKRNNSVQPSLDMMVEKAIGLLQKNENGFFLMVEGGRIDKGHHENRAKHALEETLELEKAVKLAKGCLILESFFNLRKMRQITILNLCTKISNLVYKSLVNLLLYKCVLSGISIA